MTISVRKMEPGDIPAVVEIDRTSFSLPWPESSYRYEIHDNTASRCLVAVDEDNGIVAMIVSWMIIDELHIATFATHSGYRRKGIGKLLLRAALNEASEGGARRAFLEVRESNEAAQAMYGAFGFKIAGRRPKYYRDNDEDAILMTLEPLEAA
jgi:ribosomal-protein-alanine N-acetyltransferase